MTSLFITTLKEKRKSLLYYGLGALAVLLLYIAIYPSVQNQMEMINKLLESYPPALMKAFNFQSNSFGNLGGYLSTEDYGIFWPMILMFMTVSFCSSLLAGEVESGTMGLLLSLPISRSKIYLSKLLAVFVAVIVFVLLSVVTISPIARAFSLSIGFSNVIKLALMGLLLGAAIAGVAFFFSAWLSDKGRVNAIVGGILVLMYVLNLVASLTDRLASLKYFSFFYYYNPADVLQNGSISTLSIGVFFIIALIFSALGLALFTRRDFTI